MFLFFPPTQVREALEGRDFHPVASVPVLHVSVFPVDGERIQEHLRVGNGCSVIAPQNKELHAAAAQAAVPPWVQAERRHEGVPGEGRLAARPDRASPLGAGPQAAEGPAGGAALHPETGEGQSRHQRLRPIHGGTPGRRGDGKGQMTEGGRSVAPSGRQR